MPLITAMHIVRMAVIAPLHLILLQILNEIDKDRQSDDGKTT